MPDNVLKSGVEVISWIILAALGVLVVMNASKVAEVVSSVDSFWVTETKLISGSGYNTSGYGS